MGRNKRNVQPASSIYPPTPASERGTRTSSIFPYSVARPPTGYTSPPAPQQFDMNLVSPPTANPFGEDEEEIPVDTRETPMYARSDWGATTGVGTAFSRSTFPENNGQGQDQLAIPPLPLANNDDGMSEIGAPKTIWSRSSYHPENDDDEDLLPPPIVGPGLERGHAMDDVYTGQAPTTAWTRSSYAPTIPFSPIVNQPLPPTPSRPARNPTRPQPDSTRISRFPKDRYTGPAGRGQSQLVDITELSEDSHSTRPHSEIFGHDRLSVDVVPIQQPNNPFSPAFATAHQDLPIPRSAPLSGDAGKNIQHRSTLPSILDLEHLAARPRTLLHSQSLRRPRSAGDVLDPPQIPFNRMGAESPRLLTPEAQNRLGRMSVATARYSAPPSRGTNTSRSNPSCSSNPDSTMSRTSVIRSLKKPASWLGNIRDTKVVRWYRTWRVFINAGHVLGAALLLTIALADPASGLGYIVKIKDGGLASMPADAGFGLGVSGWCQLQEEEVCSMYRKDDFKNGDDTFKVADNTIFNLLYPLWTALTSIIWLQALFLLTTSFLHFYLFFILSIPFDHLVNTALDNQDEEEGREKEDQVQREVDIRAQCERPPFEEYIWVWWSWWAFRRGPLAHLYGIVTGSLAVVCFALGYRFKSELSKAATAGTVSFGVGGYLPIAILVMIFDPFIASIAYFLIRPKRSFNTFINPPDPTPAAILLPQAEKPLARRRRATGMETFFAPPTSARFSRNREFLPAQPKQAGDVAPLPAEVDVDEETMRWLVEYPRDPELVPFITDLRSGGHNDDFILSDVGLLYLRPDDQDPNGAALLVPPNGVIRREVMEDAHVMEDGQHRGYVSMVSQLGEVFWWVGMEDDIELEIGRCAACAQTQTTHIKGQGQPQAGAGEVDDGKSMYTGVTGWSVNEDEKKENALAADMAIAMRRADEEAKKKWEA